MIHTNVTRVEVVDSVKNEVIATPTMSVQRQYNRQYSKKTLFQGNGRTLLWEGLGRDVSEANSAFEVCNIAGLNYNVKTEPIYTADGAVIPNMVATRRYDPVDTETEVASTVYGVVTNRYVPVQNHQGFEFIDSLFGHHGFQVETAGQFFDGKIVWVEAKLPEKVMVGEKICPYLVFTNRHDGKGSVRIFLTPVRIICSNTLNYAIRGSKGRAFNVRHTTTATQKLETAKETLNNYYEYLNLMELDIEHQKRVILTDNKLNMMIENLLQFKESDSNKTKERILAHRQELKQCYNASDLDGYGDNGFRFINAVSDWATHRIPNRRTVNYASNLFQNTLNGNEYIDAAYEMVKEMEETKSIAVT